MFQLLIITRQDLKPIGTELAIFMTEEAREEAVMSLNRMNLVRHKKDDDGKATPEAKAMNQLNCLYVRL
jgi:hypothetical protein